MSARRAFIHQKADEDGYTLVELLISLILASILMAMGLIIATTFFNAEKVIDTSYANLNQLLPVSTTFQQYIRSAVSPAPTKTTAGTPGQPTPPFGTYTTAGSLTPSVRFTTSALTFFTNVDTHTVATIAKITATYTKTTSTPPTTPTTRTVPSVTRKGTFVVTKITATPTSCPVSDATYTKHCKFATTGRKSTPIRVDDVRMSSTPVFTYYCAHSGDGCTDAGTAMPASDFSTCTATQCDAAEIESIGVKLIINTNSRVGHTADEETVTYEISSSSQAFNPAVG